MAAPEHHWLRHSKVDSEVDKLVITADFLTSYIGSLAQLMGSLKRVGEGLKRGVCVHVYEITPPSYIQYTCVARCSYLVTQTSTLIVPKSAYTV